MATKEYKTDNIHINFNIVDSNSNYGADGQVLSRDSGGITWIDGSAIPGGASGTGTANYVTKWSNTTGSLVDSLIYDNGTNVGIGTTSPSAKLEIVKGSEGTYLIAGGDNASNSRALSFTSSTSASNGAKHTISALSGNGQIALATASADRLLVDQFGTIKFNDYGDGNKTGDVDYLLGVNSFGTIFEANTNTLPGGPYLPLTGGTLSGNLTISNTAPSLNFNDSNSTSGHRRYRLIADNDSFQFQKLNDAGSVVNSVPLSFSYTGAATFSDTLAVSGTGDSYFTGNLGIGVTGPQAKLHVVETGAVYSAIFENSGQAYSFATIKVAEAVNNLAGLTFAIGNGLASTDIMGDIQGIVTSNGGALTGDVIIRTNQGDSVRERMRIDSAGNVGIANANPVGNAVGDGGQNLVVGNSTNAAYSSAISIISGATSGWSYLLFGDGDSSAGYRGQVRYYNGSDYMEINTAGATRININSAGAIKFNNYGVGFLQTDASGNITASGSTILPGGPYLPVANPTFTGTLTGPNGVFTANAVAAKGTVEITSADPTLRFKYNGGSAIADQNTYEIRNMGLASHTYLQFRTINDAENVFTTRMALWQSGGLYLGSSITDVGAGNLKVEGSVFAPFYTSDGTRGFKQDGVAFVSTYSDGSDANQANDIGSTSNEWRNAYFSGNGIFGGTLAVSGSGDSYFTGNLGIGVTGPTNTTHIYKNATIGPLTTTNVANAGLRIQDNASSMYFDGNSIVLDSAGYLTTNANHTFAIGTNNVQRITVLGTGNVGIGTTSPNGRLDIKNSESGFEFFPAYSTNTNLILNYDRTAGMYNNLQTRAATHQFLIGSSERMRITSAGNVGIGNTAPSQKLHITGNARVTGAYYDSTGSTGSPGTSGQVLSSTVTGTDWITPASGGTGTVTSVTAGAGMTQSGTSTINPTLDVATVLNGGITINANDIQVDSTVVRTAGNFTIAGGLDLTGSVDVTAGSLSAPTVAVGDDSTSVATTAWVKDQGYGTGTGTIGGTAVDTRVAYGLGTNTITSQSDFAFVTSVANEKRLRLQNSVIQTGNISATASGSLVGSLRYRTFVPQVGRTQSTVEMCVQTGASTYVWTALYTSSTW